MFLGDSEQTEQSSSIDVDPIAVEQKPALQATAYGIYALDTNTVVLEENADAVVPIASVTKLFIANTFMQRNDLLATTTVTWGELAAEGEAGHLMYGAVYTHRELLYALLLESSNDAAAALERIDPMLVAETAALYDGVELVDASGLSDNNTASVNTLLEATASLYRTNRHLFDITAMPILYGAETGWRNNNPFVSDAAYRGGKHGFTYEAGQTAVGVFADAGTEYVYVVLGSDELMSDMQQLRSVIQKGG